MEKTKAMCLSKSEVIRIRKETRERREREWIRDSIALRGKPPSYSLRAMFDLCDFLQKINRGEDERNRRHS